MLTLEQPARSTKIDKQQLTLMQRFAIFKQLRILSNNTSLKLLYLSGFFLFFAVDTFYEFYPAFLVKKWHMQSLEIAFTTAVLSIGITIGSVWFSRFVSQRFAVVPIILWHISLFIFMLLLTLFVNKILILYMLFGAIGICIAVCSTHVYVHISKNTDEHQQGQALGIATSLRMLGDATISLLGGFMIIISVSLPIITAIVMAIIAALILKKGASHLS